MVVNGRKSCSINNGCMTSIQSAKVDKNYKKVPLWKYDVIAKLLH